MLRSIQGVRSRLVVSGDKAALKKALDRGSPRRLPTITLRLILAAHAELLHLTVEAGGRVGGDG